MQHRTSFTGFQIKMQDHVSRPLQKYRQPTWQNCIYCQPFSSRYLAAGNSLSLSKSAQILLMSNMELRTIVIFHNCVADVADIMIRAKVRYGNGQMLIRGRNQESTRQSRYEIPPYGTTRVKGWQLSSIKPLTLLLH